MKNNPALYRQIKLAGEAITAHNSWINDVPFADINLCYASMQHLLRAYEGTVPIAAYLTSEVGSTPYRDEPPLRAFIETLDAIIAQSRREPLEAERLATELENIPTRIAGRLVDKGYGHEVHGLFMTTREARGTLLKHAHALREGLPALIENRDRCRAVYVKASREDPSMPTRPENE